MKEALKMALEALETPRPFDDYPPLWRAYKKTINEAITAIKKALAQPYQEPVAWMCQSAGYIALAHNKPDQSLNPLPIYLAPPPCPTCEALARTVMLDQTSHDAQRKPLTDEQIHIRYKTMRGDTQPRYIEIYRDCEAAHGIKE